MADHASCTQRQTDSRHPSGIAHPVRSAGVDLVNRARMESARTGHLATITPGGRPHVVVCCFALVADTVYTAVDAKPKSTTELKRLANVRAHPQVSLLVDHYDDDWSALWWVHVDGSARVIDGGGEDEYERALDALVEKYEQYRAARPSGAVIAIEIERWRAWASA